MSSLCVVHLLWGPLGPEPAERFARSYRRHPAGSGHQVLTIFNGFADEPARAAARAALDGIDAGELHLDRPVIDLHAYRQAAVVSDASHLLFLNSYAEVLADGWLAKLGTAVTASDAGIVGATASWESGLTSAPWPYKPHRLPLFPRFPNPHVRTSGFAMPRDLLLDLHWPPVRRKLAAWRLEGGRRSLTRQVLDRGLRAAVVGRDGLAYGPPDWERSATFRAGGQRNLLLADNRTRDYDRADPAERERLRRFAWGASDAAQRHADDPAADRRPHDRGDRDVEQEPECGTADGGRPGVG